MRKREKVQREAKPKPKQERKPMRALDAAKMSEESKEVKKAKSQDAKMKNINKRDGRAQKSCVAVCSLVASCKFVAKRRFGRGRVKIP